MSELDRRKIREAVELSDYSVGNGRPYVGETRNRRLDMLMQYFVNKFPASATDLRVSTSFIENEIETILSESSQSTSPVDEFSSKFEDLPSEIGAQSLEDFQTGFPLNLSDWPLGDEITHREHTFHNIHQEAWMAKYADPAQTDPEFVELFEELPNQFGEGFSYWEINYAARDPEYVVEVIERTLEIVLGQIIYSMFPWGHSNQFPQGNVWNRPWSELRPPFVYIIRDSSGYYDHYFDDDISPRTGIQMFADRVDRLEFRYQQIPQLESSNIIERKLNIAFRNFHSGATEPNRRRAFLDYWRAIETLCLFGDENMKEAVPRIKSVVQYETDDTLFENRVEEIKNKRNSYVHEQVDIEVAERDNEFIRRIFYELVPFFIINRNSDIDVFKTWLDDGNKSLQDLEHKIQGKAEELDTLRRIRNSKDL